ncbi:MAG: alpha/beta hydrolase [Planctomycetota bacterium]
MTEPAVNVFRTSDGYQHHYRHWQPADRPRSFIVALHGIQSHSGWYEHSSRTLCDAGHEVLFVDRRGSGLNQKERGHARHQRRLVNDVAQFVRDVRERRNEVAPTAPVVLLGLSWGGKLAAVVASRFQPLLDGLVLLYPGIQSKVRANWWDNFRLSLARAGEVFEKRVPIPLDDPRLFTANTESQQFIRDDELSLRDVSVSFLLANRDLDRIVQRAAPDIRCPVTMMLAGRDEIVDNAASKRWYEKLATQERSLFEYPNATHTLEFDPARDQFESDLIGWLDGLQKTT